MARLANPAAGNPKSLVKELKEALALAERKSDILTNLLKEANAEYERALDSVTKSEATLRSVLEYAPEAIYIFNLATRRFVFCNFYTCKWLGYSRQELLEMRVQDILEPPASKLQENLQAAKNHGNLYLQERRFQKRDGSIVDAEVTGTVIDYQGQQCLVAMVRDVTERKRMQDLQRYKDLFEGVSDPVFINDLEGRILEVNDVACQRFGYSRDQLLTMKIWDLVIWEETPQTRQFAKQMQNQQAVQLELYGITKDGRKSPFEFHSKPIKFKRQSAVLSVGRDLSFRKEMEQALIRAERLSAVGEMAGGVAHNFNNLLQTIMSATNGALANIDGAGPEKVIEALQTIQLAARRGAGVVKRISDFSKGTDGHQDGTEVFDLALLVDDAVWLTKPLWKKPEDPCKYSVKVQRDGECFVKGSSSEISEVVVNLIRNALDAMPQGGALNLTTELEEQRVRLTVVDRGEGIPAENLQRIFQPFFTTRGSLGSGLGLASSYGTISKYQGEITVESELGAGSTFTVTFPAAACCPLPEHRRAVVCGEGPLRVMLLDDDQNVLKALGFGLEQHDVEVVTPQSAAELVDALGQPLISAVICDFSMDQMNGLEVARLIKDACRAKGSARPPFILLTGLAKKLDSENLAQSGVDRVLNKPIEIDELVGAIRELASVQDMTEFNGQL
jgi:two-component system cell cycle sensor histidine kinase/response regulator CckA